MNDEPLPTRHPNPNDDRSTYWYLWALIPLVLGFFLMRSSSQEPQPRKRASPEAEASLRSLQAIQVSLHLYKMNQGAYPGFGANGARLAESPNFNVPCAPKGAKDQGTTRNAALTELLAEKCLLGPELGVDIRDGAVWDAWGRPVVVRILAVPGSGGVKQRCFLWSYGPDGINGVDATPDYVNRGAPDYDKEEAARIERSFKDCGDDITWSDGRMAIDR